MRTHAPFAEIICAGAALLIAASAPAQNLYVAAEGFSNPVLPIGYSPSGTIYEVTPGGGNTVFATDLGTAVRGLTFDESGDLFALSAGGLGNVVEIAPGGTRSTYASALSTPFDLAFNSSGDLFVSEGGVTAGGEIVEIAPGGGTLATFLTGLDEPRGLAFNSAGNLFVADIGRSNIVEITPGGTKTVFATGLAGPSGLAFNSAGDLFVADTTSGDITEIAPDGMETTYATGLEHPRYLAFGSTGDLFVSNLGIPDAGVYDEGYLTEITPNGTESNFDNGFVDLSGLAFSPVPEPSAALLIVIESCVLCITSRMTGHRRLILDATRHTN
jgi:sugar lactone lactonase YvrE